MKGIFAECGWGFAALFGVKIGIAVQVILFAAGMFFFRALAYDNSSDVKESRLPGFCALTCFALGKGMLRDYAILFGAKFYIFGDAAEFAFIALSLGYISSQSGGNKSAVTVAEASLILIIRTIAVMIYRSASPAENEFAALVLLLMGMAGFICEFASAFSEKRDISAVGLAAGVTISFCISSIS
ncbi:MAG: hypothetical protein PUB37_01465 [Firmicutes bacterium]|nr:hypothetical protein [Bacillota bacterium]